MAKVANNKVVKENLKPNETIPELHKLPTSTSSIIRGSPHLYDFDPLFKKDLVNLRMYYNCANSTEMNKACRADYLFHLLNENSLLSMFCSLPEHPFSRYDRRMGFIVQHSVAFIIAILFVSLNKTLALVLNIFVVIPIRMFINTSFWMVVACPCLQGTKHGCLRCIFGCCEHMGSGFAHICVLISLIWFVLAGYATARGDKFNALGSYLWSVFVIGQVIENIMTYLHFVSCTYYIEISICCVPVYVIGTWYQDYLTRQKFECRKRSICCLYPFLSIKIGNAEHGIVPIDDPDIETPEVVANDNNGQEEESQSHQSVIIPSYPIQQSDTTATTIASYDSLRNMINSSNSIQNQ